MPIIYLTNWHAKLPTRCQSITLNNQLFLVFFLPAKINHCKRLIGIFENFGEKLSDYLKDYQKEQKKKKK